MAAVMCLVHTQETGRAPVPSLQEPLQEELPPRRAAEKAAEAACQEARTSVDGHAWFRKT